MPPAIAAPTAQQTAALAAPAINGESLTTLLVENFRLDLFLAESSGTALRDEYLGIALANEEVEARLHVVLLWLEVKQTERRIFRLDLGILDFLEF